MKHYTTTSDTDFYQTPEKQLEEFFDYYNRKLLDGSVMPLPFPDYDIIKNQNQDPLYAEVLQLILNNNILIA